MFELLPYKLFDMFLMYTLVIKFNLYTYKGDVADCIKSSYNNRSSLYVIYIASDYEITVSQFLFYI